MDFKLKYLKYKLKYLDLKKLIGGAVPPVKTLTGTTIKCLAWRSLRMDA